ncbi:hypothetical protein Z043_122900 [Scleropages formosus]|uniref:Ciliary neurotrophic factor n=1 Tax=Scleropages formosus TaxID=113540 RepID=A0A0P7WDA3_SCLFO|nr:hypothetical protein Z043_122900 [Scleropages formosus]
MFKYDLFVDILVFQRAFLFVLMTITFETSRAATSCSNRGHVVKQTANLARHLKEKTQELQKLYIASQGDFHESFCQSRVNNLPDTTIAGNTPWEKLQSLYTTLNVFYRHLGTVKEQQEQLQEPSNPLLHKLGDAQAHTSNLAGNVQEILQCLEPNEPVSEPSGGPTRAPARNIFQQKVYGCAVLIRYREFLGQATFVVKEVKRHLGQR